MRISDWSSDVCSSDLLCSGWSSARNRSRVTSAIDTRSPELIFASYSCARRDHMVRLTFGLVVRTCNASFSVLSDDSLRMPTPSRSEEHTSELQSLMRISYAVFCLKKKRKLSAKQRNKVYSTQINE